MKILVQPLYDDKDDHTLPLHLMVHGAPLGGENGGTVILDVPEGASVVFLDTDGKVIEPPAKEKPLDKEPAA